LAGVLAGTYAFFLATASSAQVEWLGHEMLARFKNSTVTTVQAAYTEATESQSDETSAGILGGMLHRVQWNLRWELAALASLTRLAPGFDVVPLQEAAQSFVHSETTSVSGLVAKLPNGHATAHGVRKSPTNGEWETEAAAIVPVRTMRGPAVLLGYLPRLNPAEKEEWSAFLRGHKAHLNVLPDLALYWCDGKRTLLEIVDEVEMETGERAGAILVKYFQLLRRLGLVRWD
jgi:hypothetical protein